MDEIIAKLISEVNKSLIHYKKGGWIDARRTPNTGVNMVDSIEEFVDARFNNEAWAIPEMHEASELLEGRLFSCTLEGVDEERKRYKSAVISLITEDDIENPSEQLKDELKKVRDFLGGTKIKFNGVKKKIKYEIYDV
ncbi:MAG: hypothetical protein IJ880_12375 [Bacilli bacterium]|jgi:hypothetical protein|nr:hypothetical protein [Bacilli bacterium]